MSRVAVVDYGMGNILSVQRALEKVGAEVTLASTPHEIDYAEKVLIPGVGAFEDGMDGLHRLGLVAPIRRAAYRGVPILGICLGMQMLFNESNEWRYCVGMGLIPGSVTKLVARKLPNIGWLPVGGRRYYFLHSYAARTEHSIADAIHEGDRFCAIARNGSVYGTQFHPEKSGQDGLRLLEQFVTAGTIS